MMFRKMMFVCLFVCLFGWLVGWLVRLTEKCKTVSVKALTAYLAKEFGETQHIVDLVLWRFCANNGWKEFGFNSLDEFLAG